MRSFILSWFLAASLVLGAMFGAGVILTGPRLVLAIWGYYGSGVAQMAARNGVQAFERGGAAALEDYEKQISPDGRMNLYLLDANGKEVRGGGVPDAIRKLSNDVTEDGETQIRAEGRGVLEALSVRGRDGHIYRAVIAVASRRAQGLPPNVLGWALRIGVVLLAALGFCSWLALKLSAPVVKLQQAARAFAAGDLSARAGAETFLPQPPEYRELATDFDEMATRIQELVNAREQLMLDISHELRTPLTRLSLAVNLARGSAEGVPQALDRVDEEAERLNFLIDRILRLARLESLEEARRTEAIELADFVEGIVSDAQFEAHAKNRSVVLERAVVQRIRGNRELLREAIENVVRNAIRYTAEGTAVMVEADRAGDAAYRVIVRDEGPGVAEEHLDAIFGTFFRVQGTAMGTGFGLGLAIAKRAVALHGGTIAGRNREGGGFEVEIRIPL